MRAWQTSPQNKSLFQAIIMPSPTKTALAVMSVGSQLSPVFFASSPIFRIPSVERSLYWPASRLPHID
jgi:hypothetical protein